MSVVASTIENMFDSLPDPATCGVLSRAELVTAIGNCDKAEAVFAARKLAFTAMLLADHEATAAEEEKTWAHDTWAQVSNQVGAALGISSRRASGQMTRALALRERLREVAALFARGELSARVVTEIVYRTSLVVDGAAQEAVDAGIAEIAAGLGTLSDDDLRLAVEMVVEEHDPDACRRFREAAKNCDVGFGKPDDATGTASVFGRVLATDAELGRRILDELAGTVCKKDPRSRGELRCAAFGAVFRRQDRLACFCGTPECPAPTYPPAPSVGIYILADQATIDAALAHLTEERLARQAGQGPAPADSEVEAEQGEVAQGAVERQPAGEGNTEDEAAPPVTWDDLLNPAPIDPADDDIPSWATRATHEQALAEEAAAREAAAEDTAAALAAAEQAAAERAAARRAAIEKTVAEIRKDRAARAARAANDEPAEPGVGASANVEPSAPQPNSHAAPPRRATRPAVTLGRHVIPIPLLAELMRTGAVTFEPLPVPRKEPLAGYEFSGRTRRFIQCRDLKCRFPGCNRPAQYADIDHTVPWPRGRTHASNGKLYCREHHLCKTFRGGPNGWRDEQLPDGTIVFTAPTGHSYTTKPLSALVLPSWDTTTAALPPPPTGERPAAASGTAMPKRKRTRQQDREQYIKAEREYNAMQRALEGGHGRPPPNPFKSR